MSDVQIDCDDCQEQVHDYLQREVSDELSKAITAHLANCDHCDDVYKVENDLNQVIRNSCETETPEEVIARIRKHIAELG